MVKLVIFAILGPIACASSVVRADDISHAPDGWQRRAPQPEIAPAFGRSYLRLRTTLIK